MDRIGSQLLQERKDAVHQSLSPNAGKILFQGKDLLSLLVKANMAADISENARLSDDEVLARVSFHYVVFGRYLINLFRGTDVPFCWP